jgi:alanine dehydrogenase
MEFGNQKSPFNKEQLMPQEETLEIYASKNNFIVGILKETDLNEKRTPLSPFGVELLIEQGFTVLFEQGAGQGANFSDLQYSELGAQIIENKADIFKADILLKISSYTNQEIDLLRKNQLIFSTLNINYLNKEYIQKLIEKKVTAISYELIRDNSGCFPIVKAMSEIAGSASILIAAEILSTNNGGKGEMLGGVVGVKPTEVLVIGAGTAGEYAARTAIGLGASVKIFDSSVSRLRRIQSNLGQKVYTTIIKEKLLANITINSDVVICAFRNKIKNNFILSEDVVKKMKPNSVIIEIGIDNGGVFETSKLTTHQKPTFVKHNVVHYCVPNIPSKVARTATYSISNILAQLVAEFAETANIDSVIKNNQGVRNGVYIFKGILTNEIIGNNLNLPSKNIELLMAAF